MLTRDPLMSRIVSARDPFPWTPSERCAGKFWGSSTNRDDTPWGSRGGPPVASARSIASHFVGSLAFNSSSQFNTTTIVGACAVPACLIIRNRWPSGETS